MSRSILIIGESGVGKSSSIVNLNPSTTFLFNTIGKDLPFKGSQTKYQPYNKETKKGNVIITTNPQTIKSALEKISETMPNIKTIVMDDVQYIMAFEFMKRAKEKGFDKFVEIAQNYFDVITTAQRLRDNITVFFLSHSEDISVNGYNKTKVKTIGKMLDEKITIEGLFTIVLLAQARKNDKKIEHYFITNSDGTTTAKSPEGMFPLEIPNDLQYVLDKMKEYYEGNESNITITK